MKKIIILTGAAILLAACLFQIEFVEKNVALAVTNDVPTAENTATNNSASNSPVFPVEIITVNDAGNPIPHAKIIMMDYTSFVLPETTFESDENGLFRFDLRSVCKMIATTPDRTMVGYKDINWQDYFDQINPRIELVLKQKTLRNISVTVRDSDGNPVEGATVAGATVSGNRVPSQWLLPMEKSDSNGRIHFQWAAEDAMHFVYAIKPGTGFAGVTLEENQRLGSKDCEFELQMSKPQTVTFRVQNEDGEPLANFRIDAAPLLIEPLSHLWGTARELRAITDKEGVASFDWIPSKGFQGMRFWISQNLSEEQQNDETTIIYEWKARSYSLDEFPEEIELAMPRLARVIGTLKHSDGSPVRRPTNVLASSQKYVEETSSTGKIHRVPIKVDFYIQTTPSGKFYIDTSSAVKANIPIGETSFGIDSEEGTAPSVFNFDVGDGKTAKHIEFVLQKGTKVFGKILDSAGNSPSDYPFGIYERKDTSSRYLPPRNLQVDANGHYEKFLPAGHFVLKSPFGDEIPFQIEEGQESLELNMTLERDVSKIKLPAVEGDVPYAIVPFSGSMVEHPQDE